MWKQSIEGDTKLTYHIAGDSRSDLECNVGCGGTGWLLEILGALSGHYQETHQALVVDSSIEPIFETNDANG
jgi:hypothetical protein